MTACIINCTKAYAKDVTIPKGITIGDIDISGMTKEEAMTKASDYISSFTSKVITMDVDGNKEDITVGELGYYWSNTEIIDDAATYCSKGNVISRYKEAKDIEKNGVKYEFQLDVNDEIMTETINDKCGQYNIPHVNAALTKSGDGFTISKESSGRMIDMDTSISGLHEFLLNEWDGENANYTLTVVDDNPIATVADCEKVKDIIGSYSTTFSTGSSNYNRNKNMENGVELLNGITICQGETISVNSFLEPWTESNGWKMAGTYVNGQVEDSLGGGICQVSTTLYNAVLLAELDVVERYPHSMSVGYVPLSMDAALAGTWKDLKIRNNTDTPIYIEGIYSSGKITFNIYGVETRPSNRTIEYKSETLSTVASTEVVTKNPDLPEGYRAVTSSGHTGYKARLLKRVYIDGVLQSEEVVNNSTYSSSPTYVTVGTGAAQTEEPSTEAQQQETTAQETIAQPSAKPQESGQQEQPAASSNGQSASSSSDSSSSTSSSSASSSEASGQGTQTNNGDSSSSGTGTENTGTN
jgi:vancomycin resistance protein YoaR